MSSLKKKSIIALGWDLLGRFATRGISFLVFLARLLSPEEFGIVGIAIALIGFTHIIVEIGFETTLIQNKENTSIHYSSVFFLNLGFSLLLFLSFQVGAKYVAIFFQESQLEVIIRWLAISLVLQSTSVVQIAILKRDLQFKKLSFRLLIAGIVSGVVSIYIAFIGGGVYALVAQNLISSLISTIILWKVGNWRPKFEFSWQNIQQLFSFTGYHFLSKIGNQFIEKINILFIGKFFSPITLSFYSQADNLNKIVISFSFESINEVFFPAISKLQNDLDRFKFTLLKVLNFVSFFTFFITGIVIIWAKMLIVTFFGIKWMPSIFIFQFLMIKSFNYPINSILLNSFLALGKAKEDFWYGNIRKLLGVLPLSIGYFYDFDAFLYSLVAISIIGTAFNHIISSYTFKISLIKQLTTIYKFGIIFFLSLLIVWSIPLTITNYIFEGLTKASIFIILYLAGSFSIDKNLLNELKQIHQEGLIFLRKNS